MEDRLELLETARKKQKKIVVYIVEDKKSAQFRYRCDNVMKATLKSKQWQAVWFLNSEVQDVLKKNKRIDLAVIVRQTAKNNMMLNVIDKFKKDGVKVLFDLDDLVFDYFGLISLMRAIGSINFVGWLGYFWGIRRIARRVDGFIATNNYLGDRLERRFKKPVVVIPNSLNREQMMVSKKCLRKKEHEGFIVGYFSGSPTHAEDFKIAELGLLRFLSEYDDVKIRIVGYMDISPEMKKWEEKGRIERIGIVDYLELQELMAGVDINIAPLVINDFTNCKSELKYFEAAVVETTTIASPSYAFKNAISDGKNGLLAQSWEWYDKLKYLYESTKDNKTIAKMAKEDAEKKYYGDAFLRKVEMAFSSFMDSALG